MTTTQLIAFNAALILSIISPGPAFLVSVHTTVSSGKLAGIKVGVGLAIMASTWTAIALLGLDTIFLIFPWAYGAVKTIGAAYLIYLAIELWRGSNDELKPAKESVSKNYLLRGILINSLNPKSVLFAAAVLVVIFPTNMSMLENSLVVLNHFILEMIFYICIASTLSRESIRKQYLKLRTWIDKSASVVLGALGLKLLLNQK